MKHNQFKHIINKILKDKCKECKLTMAGVDISNSSKVIYIYDNDWNCKLTIKLWVNESKIHLTGSTDTTKMAGICNNEYDVNCSYLEFNRVYDVFNCMFSSLTEPADE